MFGAVGEVFLQEEGLKCAQADAVVAPEWGCVQQQQCYGPNVCISPKFICRNLLPRVVVFWGGAFKWSPHEWD